VAATKAGAADGIAAVKAVLGGRDGDVAEAVEACDRALAAADREDGGPVFLADGGADLFARLLNREEDGSV